MLKSKEAVSMKNEMVSISGRISESLPVTAAAMVRAVVAMVAVLVALKKENVLIFHVKGN